MFAVDCLLFVSCSFLSFFLFIFFNLIFIFWGGGWGVGWGVGVFLRNMDDSLCWNLKIYSVNSVSLV